MLWVMKLSFEPYLIVHNFVCLSETVRSDCALLSCEAISSSVAACEKIIKSGRINANLV